ncbi:protein-export chaperone SecB [Caulobacter segnis]
MTDTTAPNGAPEATPEEAAGQSGVRILAQFVRDFSFENPLAPDSLARRRGPARHRHGRRDERSRSSGRPVRSGPEAVGPRLRDEQAVFHVEIVYGGLFHIAGVAEEDLEPVLLIECPRFLFPYARRLISDVTAEGSFRPS